MSQRLPALTGQEVVTILGRHGFVSVRVAQDHVTAAVVCERFQPYRVVESAAIRCSEASLYWTQSITPPRPS